MGKAEDLKIKADEYIDSEEIVLSGELFLLRKVFEASVNFKRAKQWEEFEETVLKSLHGLLTALARDESARGCNDHC